MVAFFHHTCRTSLGMVGNVLIYHRKTAAIWTSRQPISLGYLLGFSSEFHSK